MGRQLILLALVIGQVFVSIQPAVYVGNYLDGFVQSSFWGISKRPWLYVNLPIFGRGKEGKQGPLASGAKQGNEKLSAREGERGREGMV